MHHIARRKLRARKVPRGAGSPTRVGARLGRPPSIVRFDTAKMIRHICQGRIQPQRRPNGMHVGHVKLVHRQLQLGQVRVVLQRLGPRGHGHRGNGVQQQSQRGARAVSEKKINTTVKSYSGDEQENALKEKNRK